MSFTILQNTPTIIDLANEARTTGWTIVGGHAEHESCNAGSIEVLPTVYTPITGQAYTISYQISNLTSGSVRLRVGSTNGILRTANGSYTETLTATGVNPRITFYSNGNLWLESFTVKSDQTSDAIKQRNTISFAEAYNKWPSFYSFTSDFGFSFFKDLFTFKDGRLYKHDQSVLNRNNIYGIQYKSVIKFVANGNIGQPKTYLSLSYEGNQLMVTTDNGITTSLGQISELIDIDFLKTTLEDGLTQIDVYDVEGIFSASFWRDTANGGDIINGDVLKGTFIMIELIQQNNDLLTLKNITVQSSPSKIGSR